MEDKTVGIFLKGLFSHTNTHMHADLHMDDQPRYSVKNSGRQMMKAKIMRSKSLISVDLVMVTAADPRQTENASSDSEHFLFLGRRSSERLLLEAFKRMCYCGFIS